MDNTNNPREIIVGEIRIPLNENGRVTQLRLDTSHKYIESTIFYDAEVRVLSLDDVNEIRIKRGWDKFKYAPVGEGFLQVVASAKSEKWGHVNGATISQEGKTWRSRVEDTVFLLKKIYDCGEIRAQGIA